MNRIKATCSTLILIPMMALASTQARAEFKCDAPESRLDRVACDKAGESPQALRHYIQRMRPIHSMLFSDYVNDARVAAWEQAEAARSPARPVRLRIAVEQTEQPGA